MKTFKQGHQKSYSSQDTQTFRHRQLTLALTFARSREFQDIQMKAFKQSNQRHSSKQRYAWRHSSKDSQAKLFKQRHPSEQSYSSNRRHSSKAIQTTPVDGFDICTNLRLGIGQLLAFVPCTGQLLVSSIWIVLHNIQIRLEEFKFDSKFILHLKQYPHKSAALKIF